MQNINLLSFFTHLAINAFFAIKKRVNIRVPKFKLPPSVQNEAFRAGAAIMVAVAVITSNIYQFGQTIKKDYESGADHTQMISALRNEKVSAQMNQPRNIPIQIKNNNSGNDQNASCSDTAPVPQQIKNQTSLAPNPAYRTVMIKKNGTLWGATRQLLLDFMGEDPCLPVTGMNARLCRQNLDTEINAQINRYLYKNGFIAANGNQVVQVRPGAIVSLDRYGNMTIGY